MKKLLMIVLIVFLTAMLNAAEVKVNKDAPLNGNWDLKPVKQWSVSAVGDEALTAIRRPLIDASDDIYIFDNKNNKFYVFAPNGRFKFSFGKKGEGPGEFKMARNYLIQDQWLIVSDMDAMHLFTKQDGTYVKRVPLTMGVSPREFIDKNRFLFNDGNPQDKNAESGISMYDIAAQTRKAIVRMPGEKPTDMRNSAGTMMVRLIDLSVNPTAVYCFKNGKIYYGLNSEYAIRRIDLEGKEDLAFSVSDRKPVKITEEYKNQRIKGMILNNQPLPPEMKKQMKANIPDIATLYSRIIEDEKGNILVFVTNPINLERIDIDVFSSKGEYMRRAFAVLTGGQKFAGPVELKGSTMVAVISDENDEVSLAKFSVNSL